MSVTKNFQFQRVNADTCVAPTAVDLAVGSGGSVACPKCGHDPGSSTIVELSQGPGLYYVTCPKCNQTSILNFIGRLEAPQYVATRAEEVHMFRQLEDYCGRMEKWATRLRAACSAVGSSMSAQNADTSGQTAAPATDAQREAVRERRRRHRRGLRPSLRFTLMRASMSPAIKEHQRQAALAFLQADRDDWWEKLEDATGDLHEAAVELNDTDVDLDREFLNDENTKRPLAKLLIWMWQHREQILELIVLLTNAAK